MKLCLCEALEGFSTSQISFVQVEYHNPMELNPLAIYAQALNPT